MFFSRHSGYVSELKFTILYNITWPGICFSCRGSTRKNHKQLSIIYWSKRIRFVLWDIKYPNTARHTSYNTVSITIVFIILIIIVSNIIQIYSVVSDDARKRGQTDNFFLWPP